MNAAVVMCSGALMYAPSVIKTDSAIRNLHSETTK
jgi:hypothetical protein